VTYLVASSLDERLTNQLLEAGRVVSDDLVRREIDHLEAVMQPYIRSATHAVLCQQDCLTLCGDLTGRERDLLTLWYFQATH
jgi:hypothetical protein